MTQKKKFRIFHTSRRTLIFAENVGMSKVNSDSVAILRYLDKDIICYELISASVLFNTTPAEYFEYCEPAISIYEALMFRITHDQPNKN